MNDQVKALVIAIVTNRKVQAAAVAIALLVLQAAVGGIQPPLP